MFKRFFLLTFLTFAFAAPAIAQEAPIDTIAKQAYMIDFETGTILFEKNADQRMPTSSMSKTLTAYVIFEALKKGTITLDTKYAVSERAWRMQGSKMFVELGKEIRVEDLLKGVIVQSGNDATVVLAEGLSGTEGAFAAELNKTAQAIGMKSSHFVNASGWPDPDHYSTAHDLAMLGRELVHNFPQYYAYYSEKEFTYNNIKQGNRNPLLYRNIGADGIKTGHTEDAGYGLMASAKMNGRRVVLVVNGLPDMQARADESAKLIEWGLRTFENKTVFKSDQTIEEIPVVMGTQSSVPLVISHDVMITVPRMAVDTIKAVVKYDAPLKAPVKKGQQVGTLDVTVPGTSVKKSYPLVTGADVAELGFFKKAFAHMKYTFSGGKVADVKPVEAVVETPAAEESATTPATDAPLTDATDKAAPAETIPSTTPALDAPMKDETAEVKPAADVAPVETPETTAPAVKTIEEATPPMPAPAAPATTEMME